MEEIDFKAVVLCNELNLELIAQHFGINREFKWEDSLGLKDKALQGIVREPENKMIFLFSWGSAVFVNCQHHEIMDIVNYLKKTDKSINTSNVFEYVDDYKLAANADEPPAMNGKYMVTARDDGYQRAIVATVLAKSVALDKIERQISLLLDDVEDIIQYLHQGRLTVSDEKLAKLSARILSVKFNTISYIMLLDKPDIAWSNTEADALYSELSTLFELDDRYEKVRHKTQTLIDITESFASLSHAKRGNRLEWGVIFLIAIEIMLSLYEMFFRH